MPVTWVRHGTSFANVVSVLRHSGDAVRDLLPEAEAAARRPRGHRELTPVGGLQAEDAGVALARLGTVDMLVASSLPRAIETADGIRRGLGVPDKTIHVIPYVQETNNSAIAPGDVERFARVNGIRNVSTGLYPANYGTRPDLARARALLAPYRSQHVVCVSHGNFLQQVTRGPLPQNTEVWVETRDRGAVSVHMPRIESHTFGGAERMRALVDAGLFARYI